MVHSPDDQAGGDTVATDGQAELGRRQRVGAMVVVAALVLAGLMTAPPSPVAAEGNEATGAPVAFRSVAAGGSHSCGILENGEVKCWGNSNGHGDTENRGDEPGEMGDNLPTISLGTGRTATAIAAGTAHRCVLLDNGWVKCWGSGLDGRLGYGETTSRGSSPGQMGDNLPIVSLGTNRTATAIAAGDAHTCALLDDATVKCWGKGDNGALGSGSTEDVGDEPGEMGHNLPTVDLGTGRTAVAITAGSVHTCAVLDNGGVKCWGFGAVGQLGIDQLLGNLVRGEVPGEMGDNLPFVSLGTGRTATAITAGGGHTCAVLDDARLKCWGANSFGQLGIGSTSNRGDQGSEMGDNLPFVDLGTGRTAFGVSTGTAFTCALLDNATVKCWGNGGLVGQVTAINRGDGPNEMGDNLAAVDLGTGRTATAITAGTSHSCAVLDDGSMKCFGSGLRGALGQGSTTQLGDGPGEMGDNLPPIDLGTDRVVGPQSRVAVALTADPGPVLAGGVIDYGVTVTNTGAFALTGIQATSAAVPSCTTAVTNLARGASTTYECSHTTTGGDVPTKTNQISVTTTQGATATSPTRTTTVTALAPALTVTLDAQQDTVLVGGVIDYDVTVTNTGNIALTGVAVTSTDVPDCTEVIGTLGVGAVATLDCAHTTVPADAGPFGAVVTADADQTDAVDADPAVVTVRRIRPDTHVRLGNGLFVGNDRYNLTGVGQARSTTVPRAGTARFTVRVQNDGNTDDTFLVRGLGGTNRFTVTYRNGAAPVTGAVRNGTFRIVDLAPGASRNLTVVITARAGAPARSTISRLVTVRSESQDIRDAVKVTVTRR